MNCLLTHALSPRVAKFRDAYRLRLAQQEFSDPLFSSSIFLDSLVVTLYVDFVRFAVIHVSIVHVSFPTLLCNALPQLLIRVRH